MNYSQNLIQLSEVKERLNELEEKHRYGQPEEDADPDTWAEWEELQSLLSLKHDLSWCWDEDSRTLINEDHFRTYIEETMYDIGDCQRDGIVAGLVDWERVADHCRQDYKLVSLVDETFLTRA